jgi:hypothetical protein
MLHGAEEHDQAIRLDGIIPVTNAGIVSYITAILRMRGTSCVREGDERAVLKPSRSSAQQAAKWR